MIKHLRLGVFDEEIFLFFVIICLIGFTVGGKAQKTVVQDVTSDSLPTIEALESSKCNLPKDENVFAVHIKDGKYLVKG